MKRNNIACFVGSFDPITLGHLNVIERCSNLYEKVYVGVGCNSQKKYVIALEKRIEFVKSSIEKFTNVEVLSFEGLAVDFVSKCESNILVRSLRNESDMGFEMQLALMNKKISPELETVFLPANQEYSHIASSLVKEITRMGGDGSPFLPQKISEEVEQIIKGTLNE